jgi:predicted branched-subunit amino acid permease
MSHPFVLIILLRFRELRVPYKTGFGLDDWIYWTVYTVLGTTGNYSAIADLYTLHFTVTYPLGFSVSTSRNLATDL